MADKQDKSEVQRLEWLEWARHPQTELLLERLHQAHKDTQDAWSLKKYVGETYEQSALMNAAALGGLDVLRQIIDMIESEGV